MPKRVYATAFRRRSVRKPSRRVKRRVVRRRPRPRRGLPLTGFPKRMFARLRYVHNFTMNPAAGTTAVHVFRANDMRDPDLTTTGGQPMGFDQLMAQYSHFTVLGSKIRVQFINSTSNTITPGVAVITLAHAPEDTATYTTLEQLLEYKYRKGNVIAGHIGSDGRSANQSVVSSKFSAKRFFGKKEILGDSLYRGNTAQSPIEGAFFGVHYHSMFGNDPSLIGCIATIEYIACFTEPTQMARS